MFAEVNGVRIFYEVQGAGRPLVLLHGNAEDHHIFDKAAPLLSSRFTVYTPDTRGHGQSRYTDALHYTDMAGDAAAFIRRLGLEKPVLYGFSDGGITALLTALQAPALLSAVVVSGVNTHPKGVKARFYLGLWLQCRFSRSPFLQLMLHEPHITPGMLGGITVPVHLTAGSRDLIRRSHTEALHAAIPGSTLKIFEGEDHGSYICHSEKIAKYLLGLFAK
ncbi:MAG: alpha/beta hydrolase [Oscillospiraceae bacterium]|nr:alpha/beta hydrolase [Oscillospiraceae bacterium]